ncbi:MAG TPA: sialidase family protein [Afifellaceae bacterium]|nr:sialidase family protein [Afifellaceae bacterium]
MPDAEPSAARRADPTRRFSIAAFCAALIADAVKAQHAGPKSEQDERSDGGAEDAAPFGACTATWIEPGDLDAALSALQSVATYAPGVAPLEIGFWALNLRPQCEAAPAPAEAGAAGGSPSEPAWEWRDPSLASPGTAPASFRGIATLPRPRSDDPRALTGEFERIDGVVSGIAGAAVADAGNGRPIGGGPTQDCFQEVAGQPTSIASTVDGMISVRMQNHFVVTPDGAYHVIVNSGRGSLQIHTSSDGGSSWSAGMPIRDVSAVSHADIALLPSGELLLTYNNAAREIVASTYSYDPGAKAWAFLSTSIIDATSSSTAPTIAHGPGGTFYVAYTEEGRGGGLVLQVLSSDDGGATWASEKFDAFPDGVSRGSARVVTTADGVGVLYTADETLRWAEQNSAGKWESDLLLTYLGRQASSGGNHFSAVVSGDDIYVFTNDGDRHPVLLAYDSASGSWSEPLVFTEYSGAAYTEISLSDDGSIYLMFDDEEASVLQVLESSDGGSTFARMAELSIGAAAGGNPRMEAPAYFEGSLPVLQQVSNSDDSKQRLVFFEVEPCGEGTATSGAAACIDCDLWC